jgi:hypothetical protein
MALCRCRNASANPPARLLGVLLPLPSLPSLVRLMPESLNAAEAAGFLPAAGRLAGGVGGVGFALATPLIPFVAGSGARTVLAAAGADGGGGGTGRGAA